MALNPQKLQPCEEQYERYYARVLHSRNYHDDGYRVQYDYRDSDGELFTCVKRTVIECRQERDYWLAEKAKRAVL